MCLKAHASGGVTMSSKILDELLYGSADAKADFKTRGDHLLVSSINLMEDIRREYGDEAAEMLERRFIASIKTKNPRKFRFNKR